MAFPELLAVFVFLLALKFTITTDTVASSLESSDSSVVALESSARERNQGFIDREENVRVGMELLQKKNLSGVENVGTSKKDVGELGKQVERLMKEIDIQSMKKNKLGARASFVEQRIHSLNSKLHQLYKVNVEQENRIRKFEYLLQVAEEELIKVAEETALHSEDSNPVAEETALHSEDSNQKEVIHLEEGTFLNSTHLNQEMLMTAEEETALHSKVSNQETLETAAEETALRCKYLNQVHGKWLLDWLLAHYDHVKLSLTFYWNECGKLVMKLSIQKGLETKAIVDDWIKLQTEMIKVDWIPILEEQLLALIVSLQLHVHSLTTNVVNLYNAYKDCIAPYAQEWIPRLKEQFMESVTHLKWYLQLLRATIMEMYNATRNFIAPHVLKIMEHLGSYTQKSKIFTESYIQQTAISSRSQLEKLYFALKAWAIELLHTSGQLSKVTISYHHRVQEMLKENEMFQPVANLELSWFVATTLFLAVPALLIFILYTSFIRKLTKKLSQSSRSRRCKSK